MVGRGRSPPRGSRHRRAWPAPARCSRSRIPRSPAARRSSHRISARRCGSRSATCRARRPARGRGRPRRCYGRNRRPATAPPRRRIDPLPWARSATSRAPRRRAPSHARRVVSSHLDAVALGLVALATRAQEPHRRAQLRAHCSARQALQSRPVERRGVALCVCRWVDDPERVSASRSSARRGCTDRGRSPRTDRGVDQMLPSSLSMLSIPSPDRAGRPDTGVERRRPLLRLAPVQALERCASSSANPPGSG